MPIYEFVCDKCHTEFEELVFNDAAPVCPECGATQTHKLMSRPCYHKGGADCGHTDSASASGGKCCGCAGGNCASCH